MARLLTLHFLVKSDASSQGLASFVKDGFRLESWKALDLAGNVYDARITALEHPDRVRGVDPPLYSSILLATAYDGLSRPYQQVFWNRLCVFFCLVGFAAKDSPFTIEDFTPEQAAALQAAKKAVEDCEGATKETLEQTQQKFRETNDALVAAMAKDDDLKAAGTIAKTKFERFIDFVNRNDLTFTAGSPAEGPGALGRDLRLPPVLNERSHYFNPRVAPIAE
jgi:nucleotide-binding universal stress UspA family protein